MNNQYWCCQADFGEHEPRCKNFMPTEPVKQAAELPVQTQITGWRRKYVIIMAVVFSCVTTGLISGIVFLLNAAKR